MKYFLLLYLSVFTNCICFGQTFNIKIIEKKKISYYNVYKAINKNNLNDTLLLISYRKKDKEFKRINLKKDKEYRVNTRYLSKVRFSKDKYLFLPPGASEINNVQISKIESLPILILDYKYLKNR